MLCAALCFCLLWIYSRDAGDEEEAIAPASERDAVQANTDGVSSLAADLFAKEDKDEQHCRNTTLDEDTYGFAISSLVRDIMMIVSKKGTFALRLFRLSLSLGLLYGNILLQLFLMLQIQVFCTSKSVHDIRESYDKYEFIMYGSTESHTTLTVNGKHRGIDQFFEPSAFEYVPEALKVEVCNIPFSQPGFFLAVIYIWTLTCIGEVRKVIDIFWSLVIGTPTGSSMNNALQEPATDDCDGLVNEKVIAHLTWSVKAVIASLILLPRLLLTMYLCFLGCRWLAATNNFTDLVLNAVALEFVLLLKDLLYHTLVPERNKKDLQHTEIMPWPRTRQANYFVFLGTFLWAAVAALWCLYYTYRFQSVLPEYKWDVRASCAKWLADATKV